MNTGFAVDEFEIACRAMSKLRGLLGAPEGFAGLRSIALVPCKDIHTFGMAAPIDVAFVSEDGRVLQSERALSPGKRIRCHGAAYVLERMCCEDDAWFEEGDELVWSVSAKPKARFESVQAPAGKEETGLETVK